MDIKENKTKLVGIFLIFILITPTGFSTYQIFQAYNQNGIINSEIENYLNMLLINQDKPSQKNSIITEPDNSDYNTQDSNQNYNNITQNYEGPAIDISHMNKTVLYDTSDLESIFQQIINGTFGLEEGYLETQGMTYEYTEKYTNETHTIINKSIIVINNDPINLEDAINKAISPDIIDSFQIIKEQKVTDLNKYFLSFEIAKNFESLINQDLINVTMDIPAFQKAVEEILNSSMMMVTVKYFTKNGYNNNNPVISKLLYDCNQNMILFDTLTSNLFDPKLERRNILLIYSNSIVNQVTFSIFDDGKYGERFMFWFFPLTYYSSSFVGTITINPNGFVVEDPSGTISVKNTTSVTISGTIGKTVLPYSVARYLPLFLFLPLAAAAFTTWFTSRQIIVLGLPFCSSITFNATDFNTNDSACSIQPFSRNWGSGAGSSSATVSLTFNISRGSETKLIGNFNLTIVLSGWVGGISLTDPVYGTSIKNLEYLRTWQDPIIELAILKAILVTKNHNLTVQISNNISRSSDLLLKNVTILLSIENETNPDSLRFTNNNLTSYQYIIPEINKTITSQILIVPKNLSITKIKATIVSYELFIDGCSTDVTLFDNQGIISSIITVTILNETAEPQIFNITGDYIEANSSDFSEPAENFEIKIQIKNVGTLPCSNVTLFFYINKENDDDFNETIIKNYVNYLNYSETGDLIAFNFSLTLIGTYKIRFGLNFGYDSPQGFQNITLTYLNPLILPDSTTDITKIIRLDDNPSVEISFLGGNGYKRLIINLENNAKSINLNYSTSVQHIYVDKCYEGQTLEDFFNALIGIATDAVEGVCDTVYGKDVFAFDQEMLKNPILLGLKVLKKLIETKLITEKIKEASGGLGLLIDLGIKAGFTILYYALYGFPRVLERKDLRNLNIFAIQNNTIISNKDNLTLQTILKFKDWRITDPQGWWLWYWTTGYTKILDHLDFDFSIQDQYGNSYTPEIIKVPNAEVVYINNKTDDVSVAIQVDSLWKTISDFRLGQWIDFLISTSTLIVEFILCVLPFGIGAFFSPQLMPHIISNGISAAIAIAVAGVTTLIALFDPDENFTEVVQPVPYPLENLLLNNSQSAISGERAGLLSEIYGYVNASKITNFRMVAAKENQSEQYINLQSNALLNYTEKIDMLANDLLINALLYDPGNDTIIDNQTAQDTAQNLKENGITPDIEQRLKPLEDGANEAMDPLEFPTNMSNFNSTEFYEENFIPNVNSTVIQELLNNSLSLNETLSFIFKIKAFSSYLRQEAFNSKVFIETQLNNETITEFSPTQQIDLDYWNATLTDALNTQNYTLLQYYMEQLNDTVWDTFNNTNNASIVPYYEKVISAKYNLLNTIRFTAVNYPNIIVFDEARGISDVNYSFQVINTGYYNTTFKTELFSLPTEFITDFQPETNITINRRDELTRNFTISLSPSSILNNTEYNFQIKISSEENPEKFEILNYTIKIAQYDFSAQIIPIMNSIQPGFKGTYLITIENLGNTYDIYSLSYSGLLPSEWIYMPSDIFLMEGKVENYSIIISVPRLPTSTPGNYSCDINIQSFYNSSLNKNLNFNLEILPYYEFSSFIELQNEQIEPGNSYIFNISINNFGNTAELYSFEIPDLPEGWVLNTTSTIVAPGEIKSIIVVLNVIRNYTILPGSYSVQLILNSTSAENYYDEFGFTLIIKPFVDLIYEIIPLTLQVPVDTATSIYELKIINYGNTVENLSFTFSQEPAYSWIASLDPITLDILEDITLTINLNVPKSWNSFAGDYNFTLNIYMENYGQTDSLDFEFSVLPFYELLLSYSPHDFSIKPGDSNNIEFQLGNLGNDITTFNINNLVGLSTDWYLVNGLPIILDPGQNSTFSINISPPRSPYTALRNYSFSGNVYVIEDNTVFVNFLVGVGVLPFAEFEYSIEPSSLEIFMGYSKDLEISITNLGNINDIFIVSLSFDNTLVENFTEIETSEVNLSIISSTNIKLTITVPLMPLIEDINSIITVNISSKFDPSVSSESQILIKIIASPIGMLQYVILKLQELKDFARENFSQCLSKVVICKLNLSEQFLNKAICAYNNSYESLSIIFEMVSEAALGISELYLDLAELFNFVESNVTNLFYTKLYLIYSQLTLIKARTIDTNIAYEIAEIKINTLNIALWMKNGQNFWLELINYLKIKPVILELDMALLMQSLNNSQATYEFLNMAKQKISCTITQINILFNLHLINEEIREYLINNLEINKALIEEIMSQM